MIRRLARALLAAILMGLAVQTVGVWLPMDVPQPPSPQGSLLVRGVQLVDVELGDVIPGADILIESGQITAVGASIAAPVATVIDGDGLYAIPGLFDMHVHSMTLAPALDHPLYVAAGVTAVRDMGGCIGEPDGWVACVDDKRAWHREVETGERVAPRYDVVTSLAIDGGQELPRRADPALGAPDPEGARQRVTFDKARGIDFLKTYSNLPRDSYLALADAAANNDMYLAGHLPLAVSLEEAARAGQRSIEHAFQFIWECFPGMAALRADASARELYTHEIRQLMIREHDADLCSEVQRAMITHDVAFVPTHTTRKLDAYALDEKFRSDPRLRYIPRPLRNMWLEDADGMAGRTSTEGYASYREFYEFGLRQTGTAHAAGVVVLAGTDAPDSFAFPGFALHDELEHLVTAGLSPLDALRSATVEPARFLELTSRAGIIIPGARADLVLLGANPLADISAVRDIQAVILAGVHYDRAKLDELLAGVERSANHWSIWPKFAWMLLSSPILRAQFAD